MSEAETWPWINLLIAVFNRAHRDAAKGDEEARQFIEFWQEKYTTGEVDHDYQVFRPSPFSQR